MRRAWKTCHCCNCKSVISYFFHSLVMRSVMHGLGTPDVTIWRPQHSFYRSLSNWPKIEKLFQRQNFNTCPRYVATFCDDNDVKVELECGSSAYSNRTKAGRRGRERTRSTVWFNVCIIFSTFRIVHLCVCNRFLIYHAAITRVWPHLVFLRSTGGGRLHRGISAPIVRRPRSREIHRIGQARVNSTVLNREIASRL